MDIALLNVDPEQQDNQNKPQKYTEPESIHEKRPKFTKKNFTLIIVQENHFQITIIPLNNIHFTEKTTAEDLQIKEFH